MMKTGSCCQSLSEKIFSPSGPFLLERDRSSIRCDAIMCFGNKQYRLASSVHSKHLTMCSAVCYCGELACCLFVVFASVTPSWTLSGSCVGVVQFFLAVWLLVVCGCLWFQSLSDVLQKAVQDAACCQTDFLYYNCFVFYFTTCL